MSSLKHEIPRAKGCNSPAPVACTPDHGVGNGETAEPLRIGESPVEYRNGQLVVGVIKYISARQVLNL